MTKQRLDLLLAERGLAESREQARRLIMAGRVTVNGATADKAGHRFETDAAVAVSAPPRFVSRGGEKLEAAFERFGLQVAGLICLDVGSSTGGFTDCLIQHGAAAVYAVDVGRGLLHARLREDPRVTVLEGINARHLRAEDLPGVPRFAVLDVAFISLTKVLPAVTAILPAGSGLVTLIKPQFEAGRRQVMRGGVVRDPAVRAEVVARVRAFGESKLGLAWLADCASPVIGPAGNVEWLAYWRAPGRGETATDDGERREARPA